VGRRYGSGEVGRGREVEVKDMGGEGVGGGKKGLWAAGVVGGRVGGGGCGRSG